MTVWSWGQPLLAAHEGGQLCASCAKQPVMLDMRKCLDPSRNPVLSFRRIRRCWCNRFESKSELCEADACWGSPSSLGPFRPTRSQQSVLPPKTSATPGEVGIARCCPNRGHHSGDVDEAAVEEALGRVWGRFRLRPKRNTWM